MSLGAVADRLLRGQRRAGPSYSAVPQDDDDGDDLEEIDDLPATPGQQRQRGGGDTDALVSFDANVAWSTASGTGVVTASYMRFWEPGWLEINHHEVPLGDQGEPLRLLHLPDLHASRVVSLCTLAFTRLLLGQQPCFLGRRNA